MSDFPATSPFSAVKILGRLRARNEWKFFSSLPKADGPLAIVWWMVLVLRVSGISRAQQQERGDKTNVPIHGSLLFNIHTR